jgi:hypothetical protein
LIFCRCPGLRKRKFSAFGVGLRRRVPAPRPVAARGQVHVRTVLERVADSSLSRLRADCPTRRALPCLRTSESRGLRLWRLTPAASRILRWRPRSGRGSQRRSTALSSARGNQRLPRQAGMHPCLQLLNFVDAFYRPSLTIKSRLKISSYYQGGAAVQKLTLKLLPVDVDLTSSGSSAPASQSARPRRQACVNYSYYASDSDAGGGFNRTPVEKTE